MTVGELKTYKDALYTALSRDLSEFEKNFLFIAAGILTFSVTFIKDIVNVQHADFLSCLYIGWFLFAASTGLLMFSFLRSANGSDDLWNAVDQFVLQSNKFNNDEKLTDAEARDIRTQINTILKSCKKTLSNIRFSAIFCFLLGLCFFGFFTGYNILQENQAAKQEKAAALIRQKSSLGKSFQIDETDSSLLIKIKKH